MSRGNREKFEGVEDYSPENFLATLKSTVKFQERLCSTDEEFLLLAAVQMQNALKIYRKTVGNIETRKLLEDCLQLIPETENRKLH